MFCCTERNKLRLLSRNEGKIKSYESCFDVRAWSHDIQTRNRYIRDWIKCDMPACVIPVSTVANFLKTMTWRDRGRASLRCSPDCKSKVLLDSICTSCHAMKECLRNDQEFEQYFDEEDFETAHWPCERCLDALKSIKMMWKVILERIFKITIPKRDDFESSCCSNESVKTVTKAWEDEIVHQTLAVHNFKPCLNSRVNFKISNGRSTTRDVKKDSTLSNGRNKDLDSFKENSIRIKIHTVCNTKNKRTDTDDMSYRKYSEPGSRGSMRKKISRSTSFRVRTVDVGCDACNKYDEQLQTYKNNLEYLQKRFNLQSDELRQLKSENISIKLELRDMFRCKSIGPTSTPVIISENNAAVIPKPFESCCGPKENDSIENVDSEIIITLKNCENEKFKKVSVFQVLHKTNDCCADDTIDHKFCNNNEDPMTILSKVHDKVGAIVKREMRIANKKQWSSEKINIQASFHKMKTCVSHPSCDRMTSHSSLFDSIFASSTIML